MKNLSLAEMISILEIENLNEMHSDIIIQMNENLIYQNLKKYISDLPQFSDLEKAYYLYYIFDSFDSDDSLELLNDKEYEIYESDDSKKDLIFHKAMAKNMKSILSKSMQKFIIHEDYLSFDQFKDHLSKLAESIE